MVEDHAIRNFEVNVDLFLENRVGDGDAVDVEVVRLVGILEPAAQQCLDKRVADDWSWVGEIASAALRDLSESPIFGGRPILGLAERCAGKAEGGKKNEDAAKDRAIQDRAVY
jgi:hypothetical protein